MISSGPILRRVTAGCSFEPTTRLLNPRPASPACRGRSPLPRRAGPDRCGTAGRGASRRERAGSRPSRRCVSAPGGIGRSATAISSGRDHALGVVVQLGEHMAGGDRLAVQRDRALDRRGRHRLQQGRSCGRQDKRSLHAALRLELRDHAPGRRPRPGSADSPSAPARRPIRFSRPRPDPTRSRSLELSAALAPGRRCRYDRGARGGGEVTCRARCQPGRDPARPSGAARRVPPRLALRPPARGVPPTIAPLPARLHRIVLSRAMPNLRYMTELAKSFDPAAIEAHWGPSGKQAASTSRRSILRSPRSASSCRRRT